MLSKDDQNINNSGCNNAVLNANKNRKNNIPEIKRLTLFILTLLGIFAFSLIASLFTKGLPKDKQDGAAGLIAYSMLFFALIAILGKDILPGLKQFKNWKAVVYGIIGGGLLIGLSNGLSNIVNLFYPIEDNVNQTSLISVISFYPVASIFIFGLIGPCCEEIGYRTGLFGGLKKIHPVLAYAISSIIFGFIHMSFSSNLVNEFLNLPIYILSGLILSFLYDRYGFATSFIAHALNNILVIILIISGIN